MISNVLNGQSATVQQSAFTRGQYPEPLQSGVGSTDVFALGNILAGQSATVQQSAFTRGQYSEPLASGVGSTDVFAMDNAIAGQSATIKTDVFQLRQYPKPLPSNIGKEDLPGGFRKENLISGQSAPLVDLSRGVIRIDDVKVLFDVRA